MPPPPSPLRRSINEPPFFDGTNYFEWKTQMEHYIKAIIGFEAWLSIRTGWSPPTTNNITTKPTLNPKPEADYTDTERELSQHNSRALNAIFSSISLQPFKRIASCQSAKEAWDTLRAAYEISGRLQETKRMRLEVRLGDMAMEEEESISSYYERIVDVVYEGRILGWEFKESLLKEKVLDSLSYRFWPKVCAIREVGKVKDMKLSELIWRLKGFEG